MAKDTGSAGHDSTVSNITVNYNCTKSCKLKNRIRTNHHRLSTLFAQLLNYVKAQKVELTFCVSIQQMCIAYAHRIVNIDIARDATAARKQPKDSVHNSHVAHYSYVQKKMQYTELNKHLQTTNSGLSENLRIGTLALMTIRLSKKSATKHIF